MIGLTMPGGDPGLLEQLAARLEALAEGTADLGASTRQVTDSIRSSAAWAGDAADAYTSFTGNLAQGVAAAPAPLSKIALAVRDYAGCLSTAQQKVAAYASAAEVAEVSGNDSGYVSAAELAAQNAATAVAAWQAAGDRAAADVTAAAGQLGDVFGSQGPVASWLARQAVPLDTLEGFPGLGEPVGPQILKTPVGDPGSQIWVTPVGDPGSQIWVTPVGDPGSQIWVTPVGDPGSQIWVTPVGDPGPLTNYSKEGEEDEGEENEEVARNIAGHAGVHFPGGTEDAAETIQDVLDSKDSLVRGLANGRTAYYNDGVIVIKNPNASYGGTAYEGSLDDFLKLR